MADVTVRSQQLDRDELQKFIPVGNFRLIKTFENLLSDVSTAIPEAIDANSDAIGNAQATADLAIVKADAAQASANAAQADIDGFELRDVPIALVDAPVILSSALAHNSFNVTLGGNRTLAAPTNLADGMLLNYAIKQDGTGSRMLAFNAIFDFGAAGTPVLSTTAGATDYLSGYYDGVSGKILCSLRKAQSLQSTFSTHNNGVVQSIPNNAFTKLTFSTTVFNVGSNLATSTWTPPAGRPVMLTGAVALTGAASAAVTLAVYKNGAEYKRGTMQLPFNSGVVVSNVTCIDIPNGTDTYELWAYQNTGVAQNTNGNANLTYFQGTTLQA